MVKNKKAQRIEAMKALSQEKGEEGDLKGGEAKKEKKKGNEGDGEYDLRTKCMISTRKRLYYGLLSLAWRQVNKFLKISLFIIL